MSSQKRAHIHNLDTKWMDWLRKVSALKGLTGKTLLEEYASSKKDWMASNHAMRKERYTQWPFCRGTLSISEIYNARHRYLEKYVFVAGEHDASKYVDELLLTEEAQIRLRLEQQSVICPGCAERDATIAKLQLALQARNLTTDHDVDVASVVAVFDRLYMISDKETCTRTEVRERIEQVLQDEIGNGLRLPCNSPVWVTFVRERLGMSNSTTSRLRCQARQFPLPAESSANPLKK